MKSLCAFFALSLLHLNLIAKERPNILVIMADDMGYSDLGCYGSAIDTPQLDRFASEGTRLSNFRVNPMCVVTRTSLLTGHEHSQSDNYHRSLPLPKALSAAGYFTSISGKWHQPQHPMDHGFDEFYGFLGGAINNFTGSDAIVRQRKPESIPQDWFATDAFTSHAIASMEKALAAEKPFFTYLAFNAPHTPLNVPKPLVEKYRGRFDEGWDVLRKKRMERLRKTGLIDDRYQDSPHMTDVRRWEELPEATRKNEALRMQSYAAVIDNLDTNVGRVLRFLDEKKIADNTLVIFLSDNGGDYGNGNIATDQLIRPWQRNVVPYMANGWSYLKCTPFRYYKSTAYEGGVRVPFIMRWPDGLKHKANSIAHHQTHVSDLYPTFLELAETSYHPSDGQAPLMGKSLAPLLKNPDLPIKETNHPVVWAFNDTSRGYLDYPWKIVSVNEGPWSLYNLQDDPCEIKDLVTTKRGRLKNLADRWLNFAENQTTMPPLWRRPLKTEQHGWGYHRFTLISPFVTSTPLCSQSDVPLKTPLSLTFAEKINFEETKGKTIRLYKTSDPTTPIWTADPEPGSKGDGTHTVTFDDLPTLEPDTHYFLLSDRGWLRFHDNPIPAFNDGAYWFRFRTVANAATTRTDEHPNVILIYTDDHGWPDLGPAGIYPDLKTPHLDALARSGIHVTNGYSSAPQCVPSRAGLLAGRYQNRFGVDGNGDDLSGFDAEVTVPERLQKAGYVTAQVGKWHLGAPGKIGSHGFDYFYNKNRNAACIGNFDLDGNTFPPRPIKHTTYHLEDCSNAALTFIRKHKNDPFFLYLAYRAPHVPLDAPQELLERFPGDMPERRRQALAMISSMDDGVGAIVSELKKLKLTKDTLIFYIGDNGAPLKIHKIDAPGGGPGWDGSLNKPMNGEKGMLTEGGMRVPFVVSWPGTLPANTTYNHPLIALDATTTAAHLAEVKTSDLDGINLLPHLKENSAPKRALTWRWIAQAAIREGKWKLLTAGTRSYLFDLDDDPGELKNLSSEHPEIEKDLLQKLTTWSKNLQPAGLHTKPLPPGTQTFYDFYLDGKKIAKPGQGKRPNPNRRAPKSK
ncbi:sulfatase-like hydrolase/transferase [Verrucomicrobiaceae bacterium 227]